MAKPSKSQVVSTKLTTVSARKLAELATLEGAKSVAALFDRHFTALLNELLVKAAERRLAELRKDAGGA